MYWVAPKHYCLISTTPITATSTDSTRRCRVGCSEWKGALIVVGLRHRRYRGRPSRPTTLIISKCTILKIYQIAMPARPPANARIRLFRLHLARTSLSVWQQRKQIEKIGGNGAALRAGTVLWDGWLASSRRKPGTVQWSG